MLSLWKSIKNLFTFEDTTENNNYKNGIIIARENLVSKNGLLRCPFCGSEAEIKNKDYNFFIECKNIFCKARTNIYNNSNCCNKNYTDDFLQKLTIDTWNQKNIITKMNNKPCPFCGTTDGFRINYVYNNPVGIYCSYCDSYGPDNKYSTDEVWNTRKKRRQIGNLKTCPFCGGEAEIIESRNNRYRVTCTKCHASTENKIDWIFTESTINWVVDTWNGDYDKNMEKLIAKPCPFCGNTDGFKICYTNSESDKASLYCCYCGSCGPHDDKTELMIDKWNKRFFEKYNNIVQR